MPQNNHGTYDKYAASILSSLVADAISILQFHEPYSDELNDSGKKIQEKFCIDDKEVKHYEDFNEALSDFEMLEEKYGLSKEPVLGFVPSDYFCGEIAKAFEEQTFFKNEVNLALITLLVGVLRSVRK